MSSNTIKIETTQNVIINYEPAGIGSRILAYLIDFFIQIAYIILLFIIFGSAVRFFPNNEGLIVLIILSILPLVFYDLLLEIFLNGQSIGKRQMKIKVIRLDGTEPNIGAYLLRWILRPVDNFFYGAVAMISIAYSKNGQRIGDLAAGTTVVKLSNQQKHNLDDILVVDQPDYLVYQPVYLQASLLNDEQVNLIKEVIVRYKKNYDSSLLVKTVDKVKEMLNIPTVKERNHLGFLETIIKDYNYLVGKNEV